MNKRIRRKCFSEILFSVSDQVKKNYFDPNILSLVFKTKYVKTKKKHFSSQLQKNVFFFFPLLIFSCWSDMKKILENVSLKPFFLSNQVTTI